MPKIYLVFGDKCFMFVLARPLEHTRFRLVCTCSGLYLTPAPSEE